MSSVQPAQIASIYRYPVKGLSPEPLPRVALCIGGALPAEYGTGCALPGRNGMAVVAAASAAIAVPLSKVRRAIMRSSRCGAI